jgi:preprotein translocase subunit SecD
MSGIWNHHLQPVNIMKFHRLLLTLLFLPVALFAIPTLRGQTRVAAATHPSAVRLTLRWVVDGNPPDADLIPDPSDLTGTSKLAVSRDVLLDQDDFLSASPAVNADGDLTAVLVLTDEGSEKLLNITSNNIGKRLAILLDDRIIIAPVIRGDISKQCEIDLGQSNKENARIVSQLHAAVYYSSTRPSTTQP